jgi:23S rRNA (uracil1939-C5)-methyltransferase
MQFPYVKQLRDKDLYLRKMLNPLVRDLAREVWQGITPSSSPLGYRTTAKVVLGEDDFGHRHIGLFERGSKKVVDIPECPVHHPEINKLLASFWGPKAPPAPAPFYQHGRRAFQKGRCKYLTIRYAPEPGTFAVVLSHTGVDRQALLAWARALPRSDVSIYEGLLTQKDGDLVLPHDASHLSGPLDVPVTIGGRTFQLGPLAFFQANASLTPVFIQKITAGLAGDELLDLYGGFGTYTFDLQQKFRRIHLVDANPHAISAAQSKVVREGFQNIFPTQAPVETFLQEAKRGHRRQVTHVIVNPPRSGLSPRARTLLRECLPSLKSFTYVSCNPETLLRDLNELSRKLGLSVTQVAAFDMFPQTKHVETVVHLERSRSRP